LGFTNGGIPYTFLVPSSIAICSVHLGVLCFPVLTVKADLHLLNPHAAVTEINNRYSSS